ncbi:NAD(P)-dependent oxidoreductase [Rhodohalobacter sp. 8-1]|uniref:NAD(P)-dependent oxidoreductase n=1 Tax=Rhodohalobacter sp. 8-1 TaxID=3131972 RepID=UPI0030ECDE90
MGEKIAFIGLGIMGSRMANNLQKNDVNLTVYNRTRSAMDPLVESGAHGAGSLENAVEEADIVFTMVSDPDAIEQLAFGETGFLSFMKEQALWVDCTTVNPSFSLKEAEEAKKHNVRFMDAPVAGSKGPAENGELTFLIGGYQSDLEKTRSLIEYMGSKIVHVGETGKGTAMKMLVNSLLAVAMASFSETVLLGEEMGISKDFLLNTLPDLPVSAPFLNAKAEMIKNGDEETQFPLELMHKDLHLAALSAYEQDHPYFLNNITKELFGQAKSDGRDREDFSRIFDFMDSSNKAT